MDMQDEVFPTTDSDLDYMIFWKSRDGWPVFQGPGAIIFQPGNQMWKGKLYGDKMKLWSPQSGKQTSIGRHKEKK